MKVGDRVIAVCNVEEGKAVVFGPGIYKGVMKPAEPVYFFGELYEQQAAAILLDNKSRWVYGFECWWAPFDEVKQLLAGRETVMIDDIDAWRKREQERWASARAAAVERTKAGEKQGQDTAKPVARQGR